MENFVWSFLPIPMPFTVPCVPHHCGRGASVKGSGGWRWCGGAECLTQADAGLLHLWFVLETELKTHISKMVHCGACFFLTDRLAVNSFLDALTAVIACQCQRSPLSPCISKGIRSSILSSLVFWKIQGSLFLQSGPVCTVRNIFSILKLSHMSEGHLNWVSQNEDDTFF